MLTLKDNKVFKYLVCILISIVFIIFMIPIISVSMEIVFKLGNIVGTWVRTYGVC